MINDNDIKKASQHAHEALLHVTDLSGEPTHSFSEEFENKIKSLFPGTLPPINADDRT